MKAQGDHPFLHAWDCGVQSKASLGVDMGRLWSPEDSSLSSFCVPGTSPVTSTAPPPWGSCRPMAGPREGLCGEPDAQLMRCTEDQLAVP